jgi:hypothetical protein
VISVVDVADEEARAAPPQARHAGVVVRDAEGGDRPRPDHRLFEEHVPGKRQLTVSGENCRDPELFL